MRPMKGDYVVCHIDDHMKNGNDLPDYYVSGRINEITNQKIVLDWWAMPDPNAERDIENHVEVVVLLRKATKRIVVLHRGDPFEGE